MKYNLVRWCSKRNRIMYIAYDEISGYYETQFIKRALPLDHAQRLKDTGLDLSEFFFVDEVLLKHAEKDKNKVFHFQTLYVSVSGVAAVNGLCQVVKLGSNDKTLFAHYATKDFKLPVNGVVSFVCGGFRYIESCGGVRLTKPAGVLELEWNREVLCQL